MMAVCLAEPQIIGASPSKAGSGCCTPSSVHPPVVSKTSPLKQMSRWLTVLLLTRPPPFISTSVASVDHLTSEAVSSPSRYSGHKLFFLPPHSYPSVSFPDLFGMCLLHRLSDSN